MFFTYLLAFFGICIGSMIVATGFDDSPFLTRFLFKALGISILALSITFVKVRRKKLQKKRRNRLSRPVCFPSNRAPKQDRHPDNRPCVYPLFLFDAPLFFDQ